jgi:hypothetical protein
VADSLQAPEPPQAQVQKEPAGLQREEGGSGDKKRSFSKKFAR